MTQSSYYNLFLLSPLPMWLFDVQSLAFLDVNNAATRNYGYSREEFLNMTINDIRPQDDAPAIENLVRENARSGRFYQNIFRHLKKDGSLIYVNIESNLIDFEGRKARIVLASDITEKIRTEHELELSEQRFRALVQEGSDLIAILDSELRYTYVSPTSVRILGIPAEEITGHHVFDFIHDDDRARLLAEADRLRRMQHITFSPFRFRDSEGGWRWLETRATNLSSKQAVGGIVCNSKDITDSIASQKALLENIERFNIVSKATSDIIWDYNVNTGKILWNKGIKGILKFNPEDYLTTISWWEEHIHEEDRQRVVSRFNEHLAQGILRWQDEYRFICGDGQVKHIFDRGFISLADGVPVRMIGAMQDITRRKEEEHWSKLLESVVINTTDGVLITDADLKDGPAIVYVNAAQVAMSGYSREELIGSRPDILHGHDSGQQGVQAIREAFLQGKHCNVQLINYTREGVPFHVSITMSPVSNSEGRITHWISIQRDISEQISYLKAVEAQNKKLREIAWMQSHGVRAPLVRIMSLVDLLRREEVTDEIRVLLDYLAESAKELDTVVTDVTRNTSLDLQDGDKTE
ncbi:hypothetical protein C7T94_00710 [Pedobacter yulinensis]|uniref:histidine kinase n=1 Tax=Pedobacter yulinensis TaxID=2126353 RepID=A0A2T3HQM4_9SPHI|nr:PAS domain S-box protein [Pedobacter yulinensis]PST84687.1 hypothetical protein C7T94_00710 [Pedobacter yulinensis]